MISNKKISLGQIARLVKDVTWQNGKLTFSFNEGADVVANMQAFVDAQDFLTSAELAGYATQNWVYGHVAALEDALSLKEDAFHKNTAFNKNFGSGPGEVLEGNTWGSFISYVNNVAVLIAGSVMEGALGVKIAGQPTEDVDVNGNGRFRTVPNGVGDFVRIDGTGVLKKRTTSQTKFDLGLNAVSESAETISFSSGQKVVSTLTEGEVDVILPPSAEASSLGGEWEIAVNSAVNLFFRRQGDEGLEQVEVLDINNGGSITEHAGSVRLVFLNSTWYKIS